MPAEELSSTICSVDSFAFRRPTRSDAARIERLVRDSKELDSNSRYAYLLLCEHFRETCLVAVPRDEMTGPSEEIAGFVVALRPPKRQDTVFVWQIAVANWAQQQGLAKRLLHHLIASPGCKGVSFLEATITPSNKVSQRLFTAFANEVGANVERSDGFSAEELSDSTLGLFHEAEELFRIGPLSAVQS